MFGWARDVEVRVESAVALPIWDKKTKAPWDTRYAPRVNVMKTMDKTIAIVTIIRLRRESRDFGDCLQDLVCCIIGVLNSGELFLD